MSPTRLDAALARVLSPKIDPDPVLYRDPAYQAELRRRAPILRDVYGAEFLPELEALLATGR
jgi:hypothetical protein